MDSDVTPCLPPSLFGRGHRRLYLGLAWHAARIRIRLAARKCP